MGSRCVGWRTCSRKDEAPFSRSTHLPRNSSSLDTPPDDPATATAPDPAPDGREELLLLLLLLLLGGVALWYRQRSDGAPLLAVTAGVLALAVAAVTLAVAVADTAVTTVADTAVVAAAAAARSAAPARSARCSADKRAEARVTGADGRLRYREGRREGGIGIRGSGW